MTGILLSALLFFSAAIIGYSTAMLRQLKAMEQVHEAWLLDLELLDYPENIHRSIAYKTASDLMLAATRPPWR
jgi:hypothetical protein